MPTDYETLGVKPTATFSEIRKAYLKKTIELHPDKNPQANGESAEDYNNRVTLPFQELGKAYEALSKKFEKPHQQEENVKKPSSQYEEDLEKKLRSGGFKFEPREYNDLPVDLRQSVSCPSSNTGNPSSDSKGEDSFKNPFDVYRQIETPQDSSALYLLSSSTNGGQKMVSQKWDEQNLEASAKAFAATGAKELHFIPEGEAGAIPAELREKAAEIYAKHGMTIKNAPEETQKSDNEAKPAAEGATSDKAQNTAPLSLEPVPDSPSTQSMQIQSAPPANSPPAFSAPPNSSTDNKDDKNDTPTPQG